MGSSVYIRLSAEGHCLQFGAIKNKAAVSICISPFYFSTMKYRRQGKGKEEEKRVHSFEDWKFRYMAQALATALPQMTEHP